MPHALLVTVVVIGGCGDNLQAIDAQVIDARAIDAATDAATDAGVAQLAFTAGPRDFGVVGIGTTSNPLTVTATNLGPDATGSVTLGFTGTHAHQFATTSTCASIAPGATCPIAVTFSPVTMGVATAELIAMSQPGGSAMVTINGAGVGIQGLSISPTLLPFGAVTVGSTATALALTVNHNGVGATGALSVTLAGTHPGDYAIATDTCSGSQLQGGGTPCNVSLTFTPTATGSRQAVLVVTGNPGGTVTGGLTGTGQ